MATPLDNVPLTGNETVTVQTALDTYDVPFSRVVQANVGTRPSTVAAGNDPRISRTFTPEQFSVLGATDDTAAVQAAITAACTFSPARVLFSRVYQISATIVGTSAITVEGVNRAAGIISTVAAGDILAFTPAGAVNPQDVTTGIQGLTFRDLFIDASVRKTSGAAIHAQWTDTCIVDNVRIGTANLNAAGAAPNIYDGVFLDKQSNCSINHPQIYASHKGLTVTGGTTGTTAFFSFGGWIGGGGFMYGTYATPSIGIHVAGGNGGFEIGDFDCGQWGRYGLLCDTALFAGTNHELFVGRAFFDAAGVCGIYIGTYALTLLKLQSGWAAGAGRLPGLAFNGSIPEAGVGLFVQAPNSGLDIDIDAGTNMYQNYGTGVQVQDCHSFKAAGASIYQNGALSGGHGIDLQGGDNVQIIGCRLTNNAIASYIVRKPSATYGFLGVARYIARLNNGNASGSFPAGIEEDISKRVADVSVIAPQEAILPTSPTSITSTTGVWANVTGLSLTIPAAGRYRVYAELRSYLNVSANAPGLLAVQLLVNGNLPSPAYVRLLSEVENNNVNLQTARECQWAPLPLNVGDVLQIQVKRDGPATFATSQLYNDGNGATLLGCYLIP